MKWSRIAWMTKKTDLFIFSHSVRWRNVSNLIGRALSKCHLNENETRLKRRNVNLMKNPNQLALSRLNELCLNYYLYRTISWMSQSLMPPMEKPFAPNSVQLAFCLPFSNWIWCLRWSCQKNLSTFSWGAHVRDYTIFGALKWNINFIRFIKDRIESDCFHINTHTHSSRSQK